MGDLGLSGPYAVSSMQEAVRQRILDQLTKQQQEFSNGLALRSADRADRQQSIAEAEHAAMLAERTQAAKETGAERGVKSLSLGDLLTPEQGKPFQGTTQSSLFQADQTLPSSQMAGASLLPNGSDRSQWDRRADGSQKGDGFLGVLPRPDGRVSSEISIGVNLGGKETEIPTLVPTLSTEERRWLLTNDVSDPSKIPPQIIQKAVDFAQQRMSGGQSPFATANDAPQGIPAPTVTAQAPRLTGKLRFMGTPDQRQAATQDAETQQIIRDPTTPPVLRQFLRTRSALPKGENIPYQLITEPNGPSQPLEQVATPTGPKYVPRSQAVGQTPYHVPPQPPIAVEQGPSGLVIVDKSKGTSKPVTDGSGAALGLKPTAQMQTHEMAKGEAQDTLTQLEQALEQAKDLVGPGQGRVSNVEEIIGNQDPRLNTLGAKMLAAKVKVNAALTPSARAGMNPAALAVWDNLLANKITPEGLAATIHAMRDIVGKPAVAGGGQKKSAADLIKQYGGGR